MPLTERRRYLGSLLIIGLTALLLRVWGVGWSLPYVDHPDEPAVVNVILRIIQGDLNPRHFFYPSLIIYMQALVFKLHFWAGLQTGLYTEPLSLPRSTHFYTTIPQAFIWARLFTALLATAAVVALGTWSGRYLGWRAALIAAALLAFSPWAVIHAHYITVDGPAAFFALLVLLALLQVAARGSWRDYLLAGLLFGLATGSKYQNALLVAPFVVAHIACWRSAALAHSGRLISGGLLSVAMFLLTSPYIILDFAGFQRDMETLFTSYAAGYGDIQRAWPVDAYLRFHWQEGLGPLPFLLMLIGAAVLVRRSPAQAGVLLSFPLLLILALLRMETHFYRNLLPAQAPLLLLAGVGAAAAWEYARRFIPARLVPPAAALALLVLLLPSLMPAYQASERLSWPDSRVTAQEWIRATYPGVRVASETEHPMRWNGVAQSTYVHYLPLHTLDWYREQGYGLLLANAGRRRQDALTADYRPLLEAGQVVFSAGGRGSHSLGPRIDVIDSGLTPATAPVSYTAQVRLGPLRLLGVTHGRLVQDTSGPEMRPREPIRPGDILAITAFWMVDQPVPPARSMVFVHLRDAAGTNLVQRDTPPWQGLFPPASWLPGRLVVESLDLSLPASLPAGTYRLVLGLYDATDQTRYPASQANTRLPSDELDLGTIEIVSP